MLLQSTIGKTALMIENEMFRDGRTPRQRRGRGGSAPHVAQAGADIDRRSGSQWHRIGGAVWRGGASREKPENLVRQKRERGAIT